MGFNTGLVFSKILTRLRKVNVLSKHSVFTDDLPVSFPIGERLYKLILRIYPRSYREKYGEASMLAFLDAYEDVVGQPGKWSLLQFVLRQLLHHLKEGLGLRLNAMYATALLVFSLYWSAKGDSEDESVSEVSEPAKPTNGLEIPGEPAANAYEKSVGAWLREINEAQQK